MQHYKGQLLINSRIGAGTQIILTFPEYEKPSWLATEIQIKKEDYIKYNCHNQIKIY